MRIYGGRTSALVRVAACAVVALGVATPAAAQFNVKKKLKAAAGQEAAAEGEKAAGVPATPAAGAAPAANAGGGRGGAVVLTPEVVEKLLNGLQAAKAYHDAALSADTPYGRYNKALAAYEAAKTKCQEGQQAFINRMANDEKLSNQYTELLDKMMAAQSKQDYETAQRYQDQMLALQDPSCTVKQPKQPDSYYDAQRDIGEKADQAGVKSSGLSAYEWSVANERAYGILAGSPPPDASPGEKKAVDAKGADLKNLMGIKDPEAERTKKPAPAPQAAPAQPAAPAMPPGQAQMNDCMMKNVKKHEKEIVALGERAKAAQEAGDMALTMAIADSLRVLQMAGCTPPGQ
jgi:hypothetical protein